ncbi:MAG: CPBP family intramembrane glutamic endopeptidase [Acidobacteriota bacterium]
MKRPALLGFFVLSYLLTFALSFPDLWSRWQSGVGGEEPGSGLWTTVGMFGPALAGVFCSAREGGLQGVYDLLRRLVRFRIAWPWALVSVLLLPTIAVLGTLLLRTVTGAVDVRFYDPLRPLTLFFIILLLVPCEEIGWRGYALPRLQDRYGALSSALLLGAWWGPWHATIALIEPWRLFGRSLLEHVALFTLFTMVLSVVFTWVFNHTRGSLFWACVLHASMNASGPFALVEVPETLLPWLMPSGILVYGVVAFALVSVYGARELGRDGRVDSERLRSPD